MPGRARPRRPPRFGRDKITGATMRLSPSQPAKRTPRMRTGTNMSLSMSARRRAKRSR